MTDGAGAPELGARSRVGEIARAAFTASVGDLVAEDEALRSHADEDSVHRARVAVRRLRSDLRTFLPLWDAAWACDLRERSRWLQDGFSAARDGDVLMERLQRRCTELPEADRRSAEAALQPLRAERNAAYERLRAMVGGPQYAALLRELAEAAARPPFTESAAEPACDAIPAIVGGAWATLRKRVRERSRPPADRELHRIRIAAKRLRYAVEAVVPAAGRRARRFARALERLQTILGDQHDAVSARERLRQLGGDREAAFAAGALAALEHRAARAGRGAWRTAWRKAKRARRRCGFSES